MNSLSLGLVVVVAQEVAVDQEVAAGQEEAAAQPILVQVVQQLGEEVGVVGEHSMPAMEAAAERLMPVVAAAAEHSTPVVGVVVEHSTPVGEVEEARWMMGEGVAWVLPPQVEEVQVELKRQVAGEREEHVKTVMGEALVP